MVDQADIHSHDDVDVANTVGEIDCLVKRHVCGVFEILGQYLLGVSDIKPNKLVCLELQML